MFRSLNQTTFFSIFMSSTEFHLHFSTFSKLGLVFFSVPSILLTLINPFIPCFLHQQFIRNLKYDTNEHINETETDSQTQRTVVVQWVSRKGGKDWEFGISRYKLLYIGWINNRVLLNSIGNYIQYPVINYNGEEYEKECICAYLSHSRNQHIVNQLYFSKIF